MKKYFVLMLFFIINKITLSALITCSPEPIASYTPAQSALHTWPPNSFLQYGGGEGRQRLSTCSGVIWLPENKLISIGYWNKALNTYQFNPAGPSLVSIKAEFLSDYQDTPVEQLENLSITKDYSLVAISNNGPKNIHLYKTVGSNLIHFAELPKIEGWSHGVRFSPDMKFLAYTMFGSPGKIVIYRVKNKNGEITFKQIQNMEAGLFSLNPKAIDFSKDEKFVAVAYAKKNIRHPNIITGALAIYPFNKKSGKIKPKPVSIIGTEEGLSIPEDVMFYSDGSALIVTNHANDTVTIHNFDQTTGKIGESRVLLKNPEAQVSFPHGFTISPDGKYLAVTNYGDDTVKIYTISN